MFVHITDAGGRKLTESEKKDIIAILSPQGWWLLLCLWLPALPLTLFLMYIGICKAKNEQTSLLKGPSSRLMWASRHQNHTIHTARADSGVVRIDPLHFLAGCRTWRLNQV